MTDKTSEMSLDDVLSSIKQMVVGEEPPVLDLTDMIKPDGSIVKVKTPEVEKRDMGAFLKLVQENVDYDDGSGSNPLQLKEDNSRQQGPYIIVDSQDVSEICKRAAENNKVPKSEIALELLKEISIPLINKWINSNLPDIAKKVMEEIICDLRKKNSGE
ncbi:MAG: hypothetical protein LBG20_01315 [Holosporaceae bacterium]|nr:hypothetical protein [Holosporaceae bacterium]